MKTLIAAVAVSLTMSPAVAETAENNCKTVERVAIAAMTSRQYGVPLSKMLEITATAPLARTIVLEAYGKPKFSTEEHKKAFITEFGNVILLTCLKEMT